MECSAIAVLFDIKITSQTATMPAPKSVRKKISSKGLRIVEKCEQGAGLAARCDGEVKDWEGLVIGENLF
jgi:hypothetical protein